MLTSAVLHVQPQKNHKQSYSVEAYYIHHTEHVAQKSSFGKLYSGFLYMKYNILKSCTPLQSLVGKEESDVM